MYQTLIHDIFSNIKIEIFYVALHLTKNFGMEAHLKLTDISENLWSSRKFARRPHYEATRASRLCIAKI